MGSAISSRLRAFTSFFLQIFSSVVEGTVIFNAVDRPDSGAVTRIEDDKPFLVSSEDEKEIPNKAHAKTEAHAETEDTSVPQPPPSPKTIMIQELSTKVLFLQSQNLKLEKEKAAAEDEVALLSAQPSFLMCICHLA
ncbi:hypothetical protein Tco_0458784 [Tanacetum coccineum]